MTGSQYVTPVNDHPSTRRFTPGRLPHEHGPWCRPDRHRLSPDYPERLTRRYAGQDDYNNYKARDLPQPMRSCVPTAHWVSL